MEINKYWLAGLIFGIAAALIIALVSKKKLVKEFDERQTMLRGNAFRRAFFTILAVAAFYTVLTVFAGRPLMADGVSTMLTACVGICVFAVDCIVHDAFFTVKEKPWPYMLLSGSVALSNGLNGIDSLRDGKVIKDGIVTMNSANLAFGATFFVIFVAVVLKVCVLRGEEE